MPWNGQLESVDAKLWSVKRYDERDMYQCWKLDLVLVLVLVLDFLLFGSGFGFGFGFGFCIGLVLDFNIITIILLVSLSNFC
jgi:hypothetical protein